jgi:predicted PurR-regulated permease PerM
VDADRRPGAVSRIAATRDMLTIEFSTRTIITVVALVIIAVLLVRIPHFWLIVLSAFVLATAIDKPVSALQARGVPRAFGILAVYIVLLLFFAGAVAALAPIVTTEVRTLQSQSPAYLDELRQSLDVYVPRDADDLSLTAIGDALRTNAGTLARGLTDVSIGVGRTAFFVFVTLVVAFFLAVEPGSVISRLARFVPRRHRPRVVHIADNIHDRIGAWARGQLLIAIIFGTLMGIGLRILGIPYAWSLGVVSGVLEVVPYVGGAITVVLAGLSAATVGLPHLIGVIVLYVILVNIESHILAPLLYGRAVGLPPVAILLALLAGVELIGILGALLAVPITVILWAIFEEFAPSDDASVD